MNFRYYAIIILLIAIIIFIMNIIMLYNIKKSTSKMKQRMIENGRRITK